VFGGKYKLVVQHDLDTLMLRANGELSSSDQQLLDANNQYNEMVTLDALYSAMQSQAQVDLENRLLTVKVPTVIQAWSASATYASPVPPVPGPEVSGDCVRPTVPNGFVYEATVGGVSDIVEPVWPTTVGLTVVDGGVTWTCTDPVLMIQYGTGYGIDNISEWQVMDRPIGGTAVYAYVVVNIQTLWAPGGAESNVTTFRNATTRIVANPSITGNTIRLNIKASTAVGQPVTINKAYIGIRDDSTPNIVAGSGVQFFFDNQESVSLDPGTTVSSDWLTFDFTIGTAYMISIYFEGYARQFAGGNQRWRNGDFSALEVWGTSGTARTDTWLAQSVEGYDTSAGPAWDSDAFLLQWMDDWPKIEVLRTSTPFGTIAMLSALSSSKSILAVKRSLIANRNPLLIHYKIYNIVSQAGPNGSISPSGLVTVDYLTSQMYTFIPDFGFSVNRVVVDDVDVTVTPTYTFSSIVTDHKIKVYFI